MTAKPCAPRPLGGYETSSSAMDSPATHGTRLRPMVWPGRPAQTGPTSPLHRPGGAERRAGVPSRPGVAGRRNSGQGSHRPTPTARGNSHGRTGRPKPPAGWMGPGTPRPAGAAHRLQSSRGRRSSASQGAGPPAPAGRPAPMNPHARMNKTIDTTRRSRYDTRRLNDYGIVEKEAPPGDHPDQQSPQRRVLQF